MSAIGNQVDGTHYNKLKLQPIQLGYMLNATPCFVKLAKYITRDKDDELVQLSKAIHCIQLEEELVDGNNLYFQYVDGYDLESYLDKSSTYELLREFADQFEHSDLLYLALEEFVMGHYQEAIKHVTEITELYK